MFQLYEFDLVGREVIEGCSSVMVDFSPKSDFEAKRKEIKFLKKIRGRVWVCEDDHELVRLEAEMI
jgi:hypothetical protein